MHGYDEKSVKGGWRDVYVMMSWLTRKGGMKEEKLME